MGELGHCLAARTPEGLLNAEAAAVDLSSLRRQSGRSQAEIAEVIGTTQSGVSRVERQYDMLVSTLRAYVNATGGRLQLVVTYPDRVQHLEIPALETSDSGERRPRDFRVVWQNPTNRLLVNVGWLRYTGSEFSFRYTVVAMEDPDFEPFIAFPDLESEYRSVRLFPFFAERLATSARPDFEDVLAALGLTREQATPVELLARSWGETPHDTIQVIPEPVQRPDGSLVRLFLVSGVRHAEGDCARVAQRVEELPRGRRLDMRDDLDNPFNGRAIVLQVEGARVGWIPDYLLDEIHEFRQSGRSVTVTVEQASGPDVGWHLRLLCRLIVGPPKTPEGGRRNP
jgi:hypothetical protein